MDSSLCFLVNCNKLVAKFKLAMAVYENEISDWFCINESNKWFFVEFEDYMTLNDAKDFLPEAKWVMVNE